MSDPNLPALSWPSQVGQRPLSDLERAIVEQLQEDGRASFAQIARIIGTTEKTVRRKVDILVSAKVIQITAVTDPNILGYGATALIGITLSGGSHASQIADRLASMAEVDYVIVATGRYPLYAEVICGNPTILMEVATERITQIPGVASVEIFPYLTLYYQQAHFSSARRPRGTNVDGVRPAELRGIDRDLVRMLSVDGRASVKQMAAELDVSETMVRQHVQRLTNSNVMKVMCIVNPLRLGYQAVAWIAVKVAGGVAVADVAERFTSVPNVTYVAICTGRFDMFVEVICTDRTELRDLLDRHVRSIDEIKDIEAAIYLDLRYKSLVPAFSG